MRANEFGTNPKRPAREGSRPARGHKPVDRYKSDAGISKDQETNFHAKLDKLVHNTFGKREDEVEEHIVKAGSQYRLVSKHGGKNLGTYPTKAGAEKRERQVQYFKHMGEDEVEESTGVTDYNPKSQGGTRKELLAKYHKSKNPKDAEAARKAGATQKELQGVAEGFNSKQEVIDHFVKQGKSAAAGAAAWERGWRGSKPKAKPQQPKQDNNQKYWWQDKDESMESIGEWIVQERGKASRALCVGSTPDEDLGASQLASCKSQGLRARDGEKSHLIGHRGSKHRIKVGGKKIKGKKYGGPLPDYGTRKGQK